MKKYVSGLILLLTAVAAFGQKKSIVTLDRSESSTGGFKVNGRNVIKVYQGTFKQDFSTLTSDSAYFYPDETHLTLLATWL